MYMYKLWVYLVPIASFHCFFLIVSGCRQYDFEMKITLETKQTQKGCLRGKPLRKKDKSIEP